MNRLLENFSKITLTKSLVLLASFSLLVAFPLIIVFSGGMRDHAVEKMAHENATAITKVVLAHLYLMMRKGFNNQDIDEAIARLIGGDPDLKIKVYRGASVAQQFGEKSGEAAIVQSDAALSHALASGQQAILFPDKQNIRHVYPVTAEAECLVCHTQSHIGAVLGVIDISYPIQTLKVSFTEVTVTLVAFTALVLGLVFAGLVAYLKQREIQRRLQIQEEANKALEQAYGEVRASEERMRQIRAAVQDAVVIVDEQARITDWNHAAQRMFQYSGEEAVGQQAHQLIAPPRYRDDAARGFARFKESGEGPLIGKITEISALRKDGSEFPIELSLSAVELKGCWHAIGIVHDITARKQAAKTVRENIERYRQLFDNMSSGVAVYAAQNGGEDFILTDMNQAGERISQTSREQILGKSVMEMFPGIKELGLFEVFQQVWRTGKPQQHPASLYQDKRLFQWVENHVYKLPSGEIVAIYDDVTARKKAEEIERQSQEQLSAALEDAIGAIAATLEQRDPYTAGHQRRVAALATAIGKEMGLSPEMLEGIHFGGLIHDIGKISVPAEILGKPGRLTDTEFGLIKAHAEAGYEIVKEIAFPWPVADMARQHHERLDGSGYPQGLKGDQIVLEARILAVADMVEAMSANRPYRPGFGLDAALGEITRARGTQLDPVAVDACLRVIKEKGFAFAKV